ncbi:DUF1367 family protein [Salmonella enterica]|nr:DUF1367 family protein [Salmonella enterica]EDR4377412.1 DUF1367 family protein [Salmonella enterica]EEG5734291.1 DUF1367 family protein [Salmonella enterica]EEG6158312.1 DUF1367 family protein [Salmonella enterica]EEH7434643.1 DUF1367 family protein [Salmonella enterica]
MQLQLIKHVSGILLPATSQTTELLSSKVRCGSVLEAEFRQVRNPAFHRKFFALLNLGFEYWAPTGGAITASERQLVTGYAKFLAYYGGNQQALMSSSEVYLARVAKKRSGNISVMKSFEAYREWVTIEAGYYDVVELPDGSIRKVAKSISFAKMDETEFMGLYRAVFDVLWRWILSRTFRTHEEAENVAAQLMDFTG